MISGTNQRRPKGWSSASSGCARRQRTSVPSQSRRNSARGTSATPAHSAAGSRTISPGPSGPSAGPITTTQRPVLGGFKRSSQHLDGRVRDGHAEAAFGSVGAGRVALAGPARGGAAGGAAAVLDGDRGGAVQRGRGC